MHIRARIAQGLREWLRTWETDLATIWRRRGEWRSLIPRRQALRPLILDRYIFREFFLAFFAVMSFCALLLLVAEIFDKFGDIMENNVDFETVAGYFACSLPGNLIQVVPIAATLAVLFSIGNLARNNEVLALMTSGVHGLRIAAPVIAGGFIIFVGYIVTNESIIPPLMEQGRKLESRLEGKTESKIVTQRNVFARGRDNRFYLMYSYNSKENTMIQPEIIDLSDDWSTLRGRIEAAGAKLVRNVPEEKKSEWVFSRPKFWSFNKNGHLDSFKQYETTVSVLLEEDLPTILSQKRDPAEMNFLELRRHVQILAVRSQPVHEYQTDLLQKITIPLGILLIMVIGFSYAARSRAGTAMTAFGYGVMWAIAYYGVNAVLRAFGHSGTVTPLFAAFFPLVVFSFAALHYLRRSYRWYS